MRGGLWRGRWTKAVAQAEVDNADFTTQPPVVEQEAGNATGDWKEEEWSFEEEAKRNKNQPLEKITPLNHSHQDDIADWRLIDQVSAVH